MMMRNYAPSPLDLSFDASAEAKIQLTSHGWATFSMFCRNLLTGDAFQRSYPIMELHQRLEEFAAIPEHDIYIVQNLFFKYNRRSLLLNRICACYVDLDLYHIDATRSPESWVPEIIDHCWEKGIPRPSSIICSGRGLYLKWYLRDGAPARALPKWNLIQLALVNQLEKFAADRKARDASRVLRVIGTTNHKSNRTVETLWLDGSPEDVRCYTLRELGDALLPWTEAEIREFKRQSQDQDAKYSLEKARLGKKKVILKGSPEWEAILCRRQLSFALRGRHVFEDLWRLAVLRGWDKTGIPDGERMNFVLWLCNHAALALNGAEKPLIYMEVACFLNALVPHWKMSKIHSGLSEVYKRSKKMMTPEGWVEFQGKLYPALYTPKNSSLIDWLKITDEELIQLDYIRSDNTFAEQRRRKRADNPKSRKKGFEERKSKVLQLRISGMSVQQIMGEMNLSKSTVLRYLRN